MKRAGLLGAVWAVVAMVCMLSGTPGQAQTSSVSFAYQGKVKVGGKPFTGSGLFKLSIVNTSGTTTLWSHDGTGQGGNEPTGAALAVPVSEGVFSITVGETGQQPLSPTIFADKQPLKLRVWFNGGEGFQQLLPDQNLSNLSLTVLETGSGDFTVYVNGATGDDTNSGLTPQTAKKTIQAAVNAVPERLHCNVTIDIADGLYRELVDMHGFTTDLGKQLLLLGDESWTSSSQSAPKVVISGADSDAGQGVRWYGIHAAQCINVSFRGLQFDRATSAGLDLANGEYKVYNCLATNCGTYAGFQVTRQATAEFWNCVAENNRANGYRVWSSVGQIFDCASRNNDGNGFFVGGNSENNFWGTLEVTSNKTCGLQVWSSTMGFSMPCKMRLTGNLQGCLVMHYNAQVSAWDWNRNNGHFVISGNSSDYPQKNTGSQVWW